MPTDLEIANAANLEPIEAIAWKLGISSTEISPWVEVWLKSLGMHVNPA